MKGIKMYNARRFGKNSSMLYKASRLNCKVLCATDERKKEIEKLAERLQLDPMPEIISMEGKNNES